jgi:hypothetical protein
MGEPAVRRRRDFEVGLPDDWASPGRGYGTSSIQRVPFGWV